MNPESKNHTLSEFYGEDFYEDQIGYSLRSGIIYARALSHLYKPKSVLDVGCGRGTWLKAFGDLGASNLVGLDGPWNTQEKMIDPSINFRPVNLNNPFDYNIISRFDLAMSLETGEHLENSSSEVFVKFLVEAADVILFSAAYPGQEGPNHINEQPHTFWANLFLAQDYQPYDLFRPLFWGNIDIPFWYQQNVFLYVKRESFADRHIQSNGALPLQNIMFMDCVHPELYRKRTKPMGTKKLLKQLGRKVLSYLVPD